MDGEQGPRPLWPRGGDRIKMVLRPVTVDYHRHSTYTILYVLQGSFTTETTMPRYLKTLEVRRSPGFVYFYERDKTDTAVGK